MSRWRVIEGDLRAGALDQLEAESFDAVLCDPPYGLSPDGVARTWDDEDLRRNGFMGREWDAAVPGAKFWRTVLRALRPGAHVVAFGGTRTYHRMACAVEDAGFEIRDMLSWLYGSGFPKSLDVSKAIDAAWSGYGTALKPAHEPAVLARKPFDGTVSGNVLAHGCGALAIDASRVAYASDADREAMAAGVEAIRARGGTMPGFNASDLGGANPASAAGRWPANVLLDEDSAEVLDAQSGGASRFFYTSKASRREREAGLDARTPTARSDGRQAEHDSPRLRTSPTRNTHPTVKPIDLMTYVARLLLPPELGRPRRLLVPFSGSGSEMIGALLAGWDEVVGVELEREYIDIAETRLRHHIGTPVAPEDSGPTRSASAPACQLSLFEAAE